MAAHLDLYVITCPKRGVRSECLTLLETAQTCAMLARNCGEVHGIRTAEDVDGIAEDLNGQQTLEDFADFFFHFDLTRVACDVE